MSVLAITKQINIMPQLLFCCMTLASRPGHDSETQLIMQYKSWCRERGLLLQRSIHLFVSGFCWPCLPSPPFPTSFCCFFSIYLFSSCLFVFSVCLLAFLIFITLFYFFFTNFCHGTLFHVYVISYSEEQKSQSASHQKKKFFNFFLIPSTYPFSLVNCSSFLLFAPFAPFYMAV